MRVTRPPLCPLCLAMSPKRALYMRILENSQFANGKSFEKFYTSRAYVLFKCEACGYEEAWLRASVERYGT